VALILSGGNISPGQLSEILGSYGATVT